MTTTDRGRQLYADFPGETPTKPALDAWLRDTRARLPVPHECAMRDEPTAKLKAETTEFDLTLLPALDASAA